MVYEYNHTRMTKLTWLLGDVAVRGTVTQYDDLKPRQPSDPIGPLDYFILELDRAYDHLGSFTHQRKLSDFKPWARWPWLKVEAYVLDADSINHPVDGMRFRNKPEIQFTVPAPDGPALRVGDHVELVGIWAIENGHIDLTSNVPGGAVGSVWPELHPFDWEHIKFVTDPGPDGVNTEVLSLAAPLYAHAKRVPELSEQGKLITPPHLAWNQDADDYHDFTEARMHIQAPQMPEGWRPSASLIHCDENVVVNGTGRDLTEIRTINSAADGIDVHAWIKADVRANEPGGTDQPAQGKGVLQIRYDVKWLARLMTVDGRGHEIDSISCDGPAGQQTEFAFRLWNRGLDPVTLTDAQIHAPNLPGPDAVTLDPLPGPIQGHRDAFVVGHISPQTTLGTRTAPYTFDAIVSITTNDPVSPTLEIPMTVGVLPPSLPALVKLGRTRRIKFTGPIASPDDTVVVTSDDNATLLYQASVRPPGSFTVNGASDASGSLTLGTDAVLQLASRVGPSEPDTKTASLVITITDVDRAWPRVASFTVPLTASWRFHLPGQ